MNVLRFDNLDDFAAFVLAAARAGNVGADLLVAVRALRELGDAESVVSAAGRGAAL